MVNKTIILIIVISIAVIISLIFIQKKVAFKPVKEDPVSQERTGEIASVLQGMFGTNWKGVLLSYLVCIFVILVLLYFIFDRKDINITLGTPWNTIFIVVLTLISIGIIYLGISALMKETEPSAVDTLLNQTPPNRKAVIYSMVVVGLYVLILIIFGVYQFIKYRKQQKISRTKS